MITKTLYVQLATFKGNAKPITDVGNPWIVEHEMTSNDSVEYTTVNIIEVEIDDNYDVSVIAQELVA